MDNSILISIIVSAYNVEQWIERCIESIRNQSYKNLEIIVIDDGSTDRTPALLEDCAKFACLSIPKARGKAGERESSPIR